MPSRVVLNPDGPHPEQLEPTVTRPLRRGDVLRFEQSGGGGFGWPEDRADELGAADMHGYVNADAARWIDRKHTEIPMIEEMS
jgi:N-methylhydantoinase B